mmetsp:Transcript_16256/g.41687  ORF Transcript_16256/g.41687 Transcript_16256/m.41687 type:complete len:243 (-) Transcript_16256:34-762(-)
MAQLSGRDLDAFKKFESLPYNLQAKAFLHAHWTSVKGQGAEEIWKHCQNYYGVDLHLKGLSPISTGQAGTSLDEAGFHYFLEKNIKPYTVLEARKALKEADISFDGRVSLLEFLNWQFKKRADDFVRNAPKIEELEGANMDEALKRAQAALNAVRDEINKIEQERERLEKDCEAGGIKGTRAKNELAQLMSRDKTDLNKALLTAEAAVRKAGGSGVNVPPAILWWMERELQEMKKYKPKSKQ